MVTLGLKTNYKLSYITILWHQTAKSIRFKFKIEKSKWHWQWLLSFLFNSQMNWNLTDNNNSERFRHTNYGASSFKLSENTFFIIIIRLVDCFQILFFLINNDSKIIVIAKRYHIIFWNVHFSRNVISFFRKNSVSNGSF